MKEEYVDELDDTLDDVEPVVDNPAELYEHFRVVVDKSAFLSILLIDKGMTTVEIAIGDNLLIYPWIHKLVRVNKSFIVKRGLNMRQKLEASALMSRYMHFAMKEKHENLWIAQRQGRAKDSNDRTQDSVLKMMAMAGEGDVTERLKELNIVPLAISYEYDPCDFLKAKELQQKRDDPYFQKSPEDDLINMQTGLYGYKGRIHFQTSACLNHELDELKEHNLPKCDLFTAISETIDRHIHSSYRLFAGNYVACDLLMGDNRFTAEYTEEEKEHFENYMEQQIAKVDLHNKDASFLRHALLTMYANPLINYLSEEAEKEAMLYNTQLVISPVPLPESKFKEIKTDPVAIQSIWRGGNYLNLILQVKVKDQKHGYHFIENKLENKDGEQTLYLTLYHDRNNDIEGFNRKVYLSVPLWAYAGKLHKGDKIVFNIHTYKEGMTSRIFYF